MPKLSVMIKPSSSACNLACKYCFYHSLANSRESYSYGVMDKTTSCNLIKSALNLADGESIYFAFQGGEPLLAGKEYYIDFLDTVKLYNTKKSEIVYSIQTNGTLVDGEWAKFFADNGFLVGLSLDGDRDANRYRYGNNYEYSYPKIMNCIELFKEHKVEFNILTVTTQYTAENIERIYRFFRDNGLKYLQFIPCLKPFNGEEVGELYLTAEKYGDFLIRLFNLYVKDYVKGDYVSVRQLDNWVKLFLGEKPEQCGVDGHCSHQFVVEGNGNVYPCDFYCLDEWLLGNINEKSLKNLAHSERALRFIAESLNYKEECKSCKYGNMCRGGGCKRLRQSEDYCEAYKLFFGSCFPLFRVFLAK